MTDWTKLTHAYGEASDAPRLLDRLASENANDRRQGFYDFYGSLCHQGSVYPATVAAVPRLVEIATTAGYPDRQAIFEAIGSIARGYGTDVSGADVRKALEPFAGKLLASVANADEDTKLAALGMFRGEELAGDADALATIARNDSSVLARMAAWAAISYVAPKALPSTVDDAAPDVLLALDLSHVRIGRDDVPERLVKALADATIASRLEAWTARAHLPSPQAHTAGHLAKEGSPLLELAIGRLAASTDTMAATGIVELLLDAVFPRTEELVDPSKLDAAQRRVLEAIAQYDVHWSDGEAMNGNLLSALMNHGLPSGFDVRESLCNTLDVAPKKRAVIVVPRQVPAAAAIATGLGRDTWIDVPFIFTANAEGALQDAIPEDPADFPEDVMDDFGAIARAIYELVVHHTTLAQTAAFYPKHTPIELEDVVRKLGIEPMAPNLAHANDPYVPDDDDDEENRDDDDTEAVAPPPACMPFKDLPARALATLEAFVTTLEEAGYSEVKQSFEAARTMGGAGIVVTPFATARRFDEDADIDIGYHCDAENGIFARVTVAYHDDALTTFRFFPKLTSDEVPIDFLSALADLDTADGMEAVVAQLAPVSARIGVEDGGVLLELRSD